MASESTSENMDKEAEKVPESPGRSTSKSKRSTSAFSRLNPTKIFGRKKSGKDGADDEMIDQGLVENVDKVAEVIENTEHMFDENVKSSTESKKHHHWGEKFTQKVEHTKDALKDEVKEGIEKAKTTIDTTLKDLMHFVPKDKSKEDELLPDMEIKESTLSNEEPTEAPSMLPELVKDDSVDANQSSSLDQQDGAYNENEQENKEEEKIKKEDDCVSSLAQGLQKLCAPWSNKKED